MFKAFFRESAVGASRYMRICGISLRSLLGQSAYLSRAISPARHDTVNVKQSVGFVLFDKVKMRVVPRKSMFFRPNSRKRIGTFLCFTHKWGNPHLCVPPASQAKLPPRGALNDRGISLVATSDQRYARWIGASFLEKAWQKL